MTIDELARRTGLTTRNVRAYQERGLLPPPERAGRVNYYDDRHLVRLTTIASLLARGYSLASIRELVDAWTSGGDLAEVLGFEQALAAPWTDEHPVHLTPEELAARFGPDPGDRALRTAIDLGIVVPEGDGYRVPSPRVLEAGAELVAAGIPLDDVVAEAARLVNDANRIAARFVELFRRHVWEPFVADGMPADRLGRITEIVERLRPAASSAVLPALAQAMERQVAKTIGAELAAVERVGNKEAS